MDERGRSGDDYEAVLGGFITDLKRTWHAAGAPSYSQMEQTSARLRAISGPVKISVLARSTTHEILSGRRTQPPKWQWVVSFVTTLQALAQDGAIPVDRIGTIDNWKHQHEAVCAAAERAAKRPAGVGGRHRKPVSDERAENAGPPSGTIPHQGPAGQVKPGGREAALHAKALPLPQKVFRRQWWDRYRDVAPEWREPFLSLESDAVVVRTYEPRLIPGLLQVEAYARTVLKLGRPDASEEEISRLVELRMRRQELLSRPDSFQLWAIFDETALRNTQVGTQTMRTQLAHLIDTSEQANITIQVLRSAGPNDHVAIKEPITIFRLPEKARDDVVFLERPDGPVFLSDWAETEHYSRLMSLLAIRAADADDTRSLLRASVMKL